MSTTTPNLTLTLYDSTTDQAVTFATFRAVWGGTATTSNFYRIDTWAGTVNSSITTLQNQRGAISVTGAFVSSNYYEATVASISSYVTGITILLKLDTDSDGTVTLNINSLGTKSVTKVNSSGSVVNISAGELQANKYYLFTYDGTQWVWVNATSSDQIYVVSGVSGNFIRVASDGSMEDSGESSASFIKPFTISSASVTTSNVTGVEGTLHVLDVSGMTANRDFNLPTPSAAGVRCGVKLSTGDATYALLLKINGTEWSRIFITGESVFFVSTGTGAADWIIESDGRIPQKAEIVNTTSQTISNATTTKVVVDELISDNSNIADYTTNYRFTVRRDGRYVISATLRYNSFSAGASFCFFMIRKNGSLFLAMDDKTPASGSYPGYAPATNSDLVAGDYVECVTYQNSGASQTTIVTGGARVAFAIVEILS